MQPKFKEYQYEDAFKAVADAIYELEDKIAPEMLYATNIDATLKQLYSAEKFLGQMLEADHPESKLLESYGVVRGKHLVHIYQIDSDKDVDNVKFRDLEEGQDPDPGIYYKAFGGYIEEGNLENIYIRFNTSCHPNFKGHSLSVSDVVVVDGQASICKKYGFEQVPFDISAVPPHEYENKKLYITKNLATNEIVFASFKKNTAIKKMNEIFNERSADLQVSAVDVKALSIESASQVVQRLAYEMPELLHSEANPIAVTSNENSDAFKMLVIPPGQHPYEAYIYDSLEAWQEMVDGDIECTYPYRDGTFLIGNGEARLLGLEGNRIINGGVYAGTLLLAADDGGGGVEDLSQRKVDKYRQLLWEPDNISPKEVKNYKIELYTSNSQAPAQDQGQGMM